MPTFDIEISGTLVKVQTPIEKSRSIGKLLLVDLFCLACGTYIFANVVPALKYLFFHKFDMWSCLLTLVMSYVGFALLWQAFRLWFPSGESLICDAETLTIGRIPDYVLTGRSVSQTFPVDSIKELSFGVVRSGRYGGTPGLIFHVNGKKKKVLAGLEAPEANPVIQGLSKLGVDTVHDPAMPMMIDMVLSRRKSRFGILP